MLKDRVCGWRIYYNHNYIPNKSGKNYPFLLKFHFENVKKVYFIQPSPKTFQKRKPHSFFLFFISLSKISVFLQNRWFYFQLQPSLNVLSRIQKDSIFFLFLLFFFVSFRLLFVLHSFFIFSLQKGCQIEI